jgi:hypothetical protein
MRRRSFVRAVIIIHAMGAKKLQNRVAALISVPFQSNFEWGAGPRSR